MLKTITQVGKVFRTGPVFIEPTVGVSYVDDSMVNYYYGVRDSVEITADQRSSR